VSLPLTALHASYRDQFTVLPALNVHVRVVLDDVVQCVLARYCSLFAVLRSAQASFASVKLEVLALCPL
jgi:hypothetical protein